MNRHPWYYWVTYLWTIPWDIIAWFLVLGIWFLWGTKLHWLDGFWCELRKNSWPSRTWYKRWAGTTLGHGGFLASGYSGGKGIDTSTEFHEAVHVHQYEGAMLRSFILGLVVFIVNPSLTGAIVGGIVWILGGSFHVFTNSVQAVLRGKTFYKGSAHEESAYAQTELWEEK